MNAPRHRSIFLAFFASLAATALAAQTTLVERLAARSPVVVRGRVLRLNASTEPLLRRSPRTAVITVRQMYAGSEIAGDQSGKNVTVILTRPAAARPGEETIFFGRPLYVGRTMTIADEGEVPARAAAASALEAAVQGQNDRPIRARLAAAALVFRGTVDSVRPLETGAEQTRPPEVPGSEHDPDWRIATVRVVTPLRGGTAGQTITVLFAASRDITWFNTPKLAAGQDAVFLPHTPTKEEESHYRRGGLGALMDKGPLYLVTEPFDVLQPSDEPRVRRLLAAKPER
jgi:hypothetical protein